MIVERYSDILLKRANKLQMQNAFTNWKQNYLKNKLLKPCQRQIQDCCNIQYGALCDNIITKRSILDVAVALDPPLPMTTIITEAEYCSRVTFTFYLFFFHFRCDLKLMHFSQILLFECFNFLRVVAGNFCFPSDTEKNTR